MQFRLLDTRQREMQVNTFLYRVHGISGAAVQVRRALHCPELQFAASSPDAQPERIRGADATVAASLKAIL